MQVPCGIGSAVWYTWVVAIKWCDGAGGGYGEGDVGSGIGRSVDLLGGKGNPRCGRPKGLPFGVGPVSGLGWKATGGGRGK